MASAVSLAGGQAFAARARRHSAPGWGRGSPPGLVWRVVERVPGARPEAGRRRRPRPWPPARRTAPIGRDGMGQVSPLGREEASLLHTGRQGRSPRRLCFSSRSERSRAV